MKIVLLALLLPFIAFAQKAKPLQIPVDTTNGRISYSEITYADSTSKKELFSKVLEWIALTYTSVKDVVKLKDRDAGKIIAQGVFNERLEQGLNIYSASIYHTLLIGIKDGTCKIQITDFNYGYTAQDGSWATGDLKNFLYSNLHKKKNLILCADVITM